ITLTISSIRPSRRITRNPNSLTWSRALSKRASTCSRRPCSSRSSAAIRASIWSSRWNNAGRSSSAVRSTAAAPAFLVIERADSPTAPPILSLQRPGNPAVLADAPEVDGDQDRYDHGDEHAVQHVETQQRVLADEGAGE